MENTPDGFAFFGFAKKRFLVTARKDGSIHSTSQCVAELSPKGLDVPLLEELLRRANSAILEVAQPSSEKDEDS